MSQSKIETTREDKQYNDKGTNEGDKISLDDQVQNLYVLPKYPVRGVCVCVCVCACVCVH